MFLIKMHLKKGTVQRISLDALGKNRLCFAFATKSKAVKKCETLPHVCTVEEALKAARKMPQSRLKEQITEPHTVRVRTV